MGEKMSCKNITIIIAVLLVWSWNILAQNDTCSDLIETALTTVGEACSELGRNQVCYGNGDIVALDFDDAPLSDFDDSGDTVNVLGVRSLATSALDVDRDKWGIILLALQANLPDTTPGQNVTFVAFGDTELTNEVLPQSQVDVPPTLEATANGGMNIRGGPSTNFGIVGSLTANEEVILQGRNQASDWVQIILDSGIGWLYAPLITIEGDVSTLQVVEVGNEIDSRFSMPMQAFQFRMGIGAPECKAASDNGLLVQAPTNTTVNFRINGIDIEVGSTALLQLDDDRLGVNTFDGNVNVTSGGDTQTVEPGFRVDATANTPPTEPEPYDYDDVRTAPVDLLPEAVSIPFIINGVDGSSDWVDSGIELSNGQEFTIQATGQVNIWPQCRQICVTETFETEFGAIASCPLLCNSVSAGPAGSIPIESIVPGISSFYPLGEAPMVALLARIGDGDAFYVGEGGTFVAEQGGTLQFRINEDTRVPGDETGEFVVSIDITDG